MDFLDPQKQKQHNMRLVIGYGLMAVALSLATMILVYVAYGFGLDKNGQVIQNGLVYFSSSPSGGDIFLNGQRTDGQTNKKMTLQPGQYIVEIKRHGYLSWRRAISVEGGSVLHYDYPMLIPQSLKTSTLQTFDQVASFAAQSRDRRWLLVGFPGTTQSFTLFDLQNPEQEATVISLPPDLLTASNAPRQWKFIAWANDNRRMLAQHTYGNSSEYILVDRQTPNESVNLTRHFSLQTQELRLLDGAHDQYTILDPVKGALTKHTLKQTSGVPVLSNVLAYKSYKEDTFLYATADGAPPGQVFIRMLADDKTYTLRIVGKDTAYLLDVASYSDDLFVALGAPAEDRVYLYKEPIESLKGEPTEPLVPVQILKVDNPNELSFSPNTRFVVAENMKEFYVYDAENDKGYKYQTALGLDEPQRKVNWMDGHRFAAVSKGKLTIFDFDDLNHRSLVSASPHFLPFFDRDYKNLYTVAPSAGDATKSMVTATPLRTEQDK